MNLHLKIAPGESPIFDGESAAPIKKKTSPGEDGLLGVDLLGRGGREVPSQEEADVPGAHHVICFDACHLP